jgi:hypothetical protein
LAVGSNDDVSTWARPHRKIDGGKTVARLIDACPSGLLGLQAPQAGRCDCADRQIRALRERAARTPPGD